MSNQNPHQVGNLIPIVIDQRRQIIRNQSFKINGDRWVIAQALKTAYCEEVLKRRRHFIDSADLDRRVTCVASALNRSDHRFGIVICGQVGNGKSTMVRAIANLLNRYRIPMPNDNDKYWQLVIRSSKDVAKSINADKDFTKLCNYPLLAIDDLGTEPDESKVYGTVYRPLEYLLEERYDRMLYTIITTNLLPSKIKDIYGPRVASRFNEMMILVEFDNPDYRILPETDNTIISDVD